MGERVVFGMIEESPPMFRESTAKTDAEKRKDFREKIQEFVLSKFDTTFTSTLNLKKGKHRIIASFKVDKNGEVANLKVRAPHPMLKDEIERIINELPQFEPGTQRNKPVQVNFTLPITFMVE